MIGWIRTASRTYWLDVRPSPVMAHTRTTAMKEDRERRWGMRLVSTVTTGEDIAYQFPRFPVYETSFQPLPLRRQTTILLHCREWIRTLMPCPNTSASQEHAHDEELTGIVTGNTPACSLHQVSKYSSPTRRRDADHCKTHQLTLFSIYDFSQMVSGYQDNERGGKLTVIDHSRDGHITRHDKLQRPMLAATGNDNEGRRRY